VTVVIPSSVTNISRIAFGNNIALKNIVTDNKDELLKKLKSLYTKVDRNGAVIVDEEGNPAVYKIYDLFEAFVKERED
jgi:prephenate dehydrogenase